METQEFNPPYLPFKTVLNLIERLADSDIPNRIDRTYLSYLSGITQTYLLAALRTFNLIDGDGKPTDRLIAFVREANRRPEMMGELVRDYYSEALALGPGATPGELEEVFRETYGLRGDTNRKGITFFLNAATFGKVPLSSHYKLPRASQSGNGATGKPRRKRTTGTRKTVENKPPADTTSVDGLRTRYIDMLMKKVEAQEDMDEGLLDRIETLLGYSERDEADESDEE